MAVRASATLGVALLLVAGCRNILGVDGYGTREGTLEAGVKNACPALTDAGNACAACVESHCCKQSDACDLEPACQAMKACLGACSGKDDHQCRGLCNQSIPRTAEWGDLVACEATQCPACAGSRVVRGGGACDQCLARQECLGQVEALSKNRTALRLDDCRKDCQHALDSLDASDAARAASGCSCAAYAQGTAVLDAVEECEAVNCRLICYPPSDWSCLGNVQWPEPTVKQLELHVGVVYAENFITPVRSFNMAACGALDAACNNPLVPLRPASNGWADLVIPKSPLQTLGFFEYLLVTTGDVDALFYFFPPVRRTPSWPTRRLVTRQFAEDTVGWLGIPIDWAHKGGIVWSVTSCGDPSPFAKDVVVSCTSEPSTPTAPTTRVPTYYFDDQHNLRPETETPATSSLGIGAMINVDPGRWVLTASTTAASTGNGTLGTYHVQVIAGKLTHVTMAPMPTGG